MKTLKKMLCILLCTIMLISVIPAGAFNAIQTSNDVSASQAAEKNSDPVKVGFAIFKVLIEKTVYFLRVIINLLRQLLGWDNRLTVSFETQGGSEIKPVKVAKGGTLGVVPTPVKQDYAFTGWFLDEALTNPFYKDSPLNSDIKLYASYSQRDPGMEQYGDRTKYLEDCELGFTFSILSPVALTAENLSDYLEIEAFSGEIPAFNIANNAGVYTISPASPYPAGGHYRFKLLDTALHFDGEDAEIIALVIRIHKDEVRIVELQDGIIYVLWQDVTTLGEGAYSVPASLYTIGTGDKVCFWDGTVNDSTQYRTILLATQIAGENAGDAVTVLYTEESALEDILKQVNVYFKQDVPAAEYISDMDTGKIVQNVKNSKGTMQITEILAKALSLSPSLQAAANVAAPNSSGFSPVQENDDKQTVTIEDLIPGLSISASIGTAVNPNFFNAGQDDWAVFTLVFTYSAVIKEKVQISATFTIKEYVKSTMQGYKEWKGNDLHFNYAINTYSQTQITLAVLIKSYDSSEDDYLDITAEIESLLNEDSSDDGDPAGILRTVLGGKGDDIDLVDENLFTYKLAIIPSIPIFQVNFAVNFVVKVNFALGLSAGITVMSARQVGFCGSMSGGVSSYNYELPGNNRYSFDLYAAGYLGFKAGLKMSISLSFFGLQELGEVGLSGEVGAYIDLYGFLHLNIAKLNQYGSSQTSLQGGLYMEVGIYIEINLFAKSSAFKVKAEYTAYEHKWPLFTLGDRYVLLRFKDTKTTFIMNADSYAVSTGAGLLDAVYLDMTTGEEVTGSYASAKNFIILFSSPYLSYDRTGTQKISVLKDRFGSFSYTPRIDANTKRLDATVYIYYLGSNLTFSKGTEGYAVKTVPMIWLDAGLNPALALNSCKATYVFNVGGVQTTVAQKHVLYGEIPGSMDLYELYYDYKITGYTNNFNAPITADTVYTVHMQTYQVMVSFLTYYDGSWHLDVSAVNCGDTPIPPPGYDSSIPWKTFTHWHGTSGFNARMPETAVVGPLNYDISTQGWNLVMTGYDTSTPFYSTSGTYEECLNEYYAYRQVPFTGRFAERGVYLYTAYYQNQPVEVTFVFPAMSYTAFNQNIVNAGYTKTAQVEVGKIIGAPSYTGYQGCNMLGWDVNGDSIPDYTYSGLPAAAPGMTFTAVLRLRTHTVDVLDINGNLTETLTVNAGNLPGILSTTPVYSDGSGAAYNFKYWLISQSGGAFIRWYGYRNPGVYENWSVMPLFDKRFTVTFDYNGGTLGGETQRTVQLEEGTYQVAGIMPQPPAKAATLYDEFAFAGWDSGETITVAGNMTITAQYTQVPIMYTAEFTTDKGVFAGGGTFASFTGGYDAWQTFITDFLEVNATLAAVYEPDKIFNFSAWFIYQDARSVRYEARWFEAVRYYTVLFDAGEGSFSGGNQIDYPTMTYGTLLDFTGPAINTAMKPADVYNTFKLAGWEDQNGVFYTPADTFSVTADTTFTAVYEVDEQILYTVTLNAGAGEFPDGTSIKTFSGAYGVNTNIVVDDPAWVTNYANLYYVFDGWSQAIPDLFTQNITINALYETVLFEFIITFDAVAGVFASTGTNILTQTYHYDDPIVMNEIPVKAEDEFFTYEFNGWNPAFSPVTGDRTYTALYRATRKDTSLPATGIYVSDGLSTEDINCNIISGYTYELVEVPYNPGVFVPTLTVTGDGLTFSGNGSEVYIIVADGVNNVAFNEFTLTGSSDYANGNLYLESGDSTVLTTVYFSGHCNMTYNNAGYNAVRCDRPAVFEGTGSSASLTISTFNACTVYSGNGLELKNLNLTVNSASNGEDFAVSAFSGESMDEHTIWSFNNSTVTVVSGGSCFSTYPVEINDSVFNIDCGGPLGDIYGDLSIIDSDMTASGAGGFLIMNGDMSIIGDSNVDIESTNNDLSAVNIAHTYYEIFVYNEETEMYESTGEFFEAGNLDFIDFTGTFNAYFADESATGPAVKAGTGITFTVDGINAIDSYDLGGAQIKMLTDADANEYYTFAVLSSGVFVPDACVSVAPVTVGAKAGKLNAFK